MATKAGNDFDEFVKREAEAARIAEPPIDWNKQREEWLHSLKSLYTTIEGYLGKYTQQGAINIEYKSKQLAEEDVGSYLVKEMLIHIGRQTVALTPVGTLLIGSKGRVDVIGRAGRGRLVLIDRNPTGPASLMKVPLVGPNTPAPATTEPPWKENEWVWKIATSPPAVRFIELNQESFSHLILEVGTG
jgi:hypothetical protein